jgi:hypothetical protein
MLTFMSYGWSFILYKILVQIFKVIGCDTIFFSAKTYNKNIYDTKKLIKRNSQT